MKKDEDLRSQLDVSFTTNGLIVAQPKPPESKISNSNQTKQKNVFFFIIFYFYLVSALLRDYSLCWDRWKRYMTPTLDAALLKIDTYDRQKKGNIAEI